MNAHARSARTPPRSPPHPPRRPTGPCRVYRRPRMPESLEPRRRLGAAPTDRPDGAVRSPRRYRVVAGSAARCRTHPPGHRAIGAMAYCQSLNTLLEGEAAHGLRPGAGLTGSGGRAAHADCHTAQLSRVAAARHWRDSSAPVPRQLPPQLRSPPYTATSTGPCRRAAMDTHEFSHASIADPAA